MVVCHIVLHRRRLSLWSINNSTVQVLGTGSQLRHSPVSQGLMP